MRVTLKSAKHAWYSGYGMNPERIIRAGEPLTITHYAVVPVRGRKPYDVAVTDDGWQVSFFPNEVATL